MSCWRVEISILGRGTRISSNSWVTASVLLLCDYGSQIFTCKHQNPVWVDLRKVKKRTIDSLMSSGGLENWAWRLSRWNITLCHLVTPHSLVQWRHQLCWELDATMYYQVPRHKTLDYHGSHCCSTNFILLHLPKSSKNYSVTSLCLAPNSKSREYLICSVTWRSKENIQLQLL